MTNKINNRKEIRTRIGKIIKEARLKKDLTQSELGKMLNKSNNVITNWEKGTNSPDADNIERLCAILDIPVNVMFRVPKTENSSVAKLSEEEQRLIFNWRKLSHDNQMKITGIMEFMFMVDEESATREEYENQVKRA